MSQLMNATFSRKNRPSVSLLCNLKVTKHVIYMFIDRTFYVLVYILNLLFHADCCCPKCHRGWGCYNLGRTDPDMVATS